jgi:hypothetical protein
MTPTFRHGFECQPAMPFALAIAPLCGHALRARYCPVMDGLLPNLAKIPRSPARAARYFGQIALILLSLMRPRRRPGQAAKPKRLSLLQGENKRRRPSDINVALGLCLIDGR